MKNKKLLKEDYNEEEFVVHDTYTLGNTGGYLHPIHAKAMNGAYVSSNKIVA